MRHLRKDCSDYHHPELDPGIYHAMELSRALPLLDHLQQLGTFVTPTLFLGPRLKGLSLSLGCTDTIFENVPILESLKVHTPSLEYLDVGGMDLAPLSTLICETARSLQHLRVLKVHYKYLSFEHICHLSLSNLVQLDVGISEDTLMHRPSADNRTQSFLTLHVLTIRTTRQWAIAEAFFEAYLQLSTLEKVEIEICQRPLSDDIHQLLTIMHQCCSPTFLNGIAITSTCAYVLNDKLDPSILHILFAFPNLEHLHISLSISFVEVDDILISAMALAWPLLKLLALQCQFSMETTKVTIYGLRPLANCAFLKSLTIDLDAAVPNQNIGLQPNSNISTSPLSCLSVHHAPINDPIPVASFLSDFFPNLTEIHPWKYHENDYHEMWEQVRTFYDLFLTTRKQERE
jgi:hypothetical protein